MFDWVNTLVQGILLGGLYALFAMGQSLIFGVMRLTNTAHGDFIILAAFAVFSVVAVLGLPPAVAPWIALGLLLPIGFAAGYAVQRFVLNGTLGRDPLPSLVVTFGLAIVIQNLLQEIYTADPRSIESGGLNTASIALADGLAVGTLPLMIFFIVVAMVLGMQWLFDHTPPGPAVPAVGADRAAPALMGLRYRPAY